MDQAQRFIGLDVHKDSIAVAVAEDKGAIRALGVIDNSPDSIRKLVRKLGEKGALHVCYEAGPCGYAISRQLTKMGVRCSVVAPSLIPVQSGDRVKTDRRDAEKLARFLRGGLLTPVWVPDTATEALRELVRARTAAKRDERRARHRLVSFLLRHERPTPKGMRNWSERYREWVWAIEFEERSLAFTRDELIVEVEHQRNRLTRIEGRIEEALDTSDGRLRAMADGLQALRGVSKVVATTLVSEIGDASRFNSPRQLMGYAGIVPKEHSSGGPGKASRGSITKTGNAHLRRVLTEAAWTYRNKPRLVGKLLRRQQGLPAAAQDIAWKAQVRLHKRYVELTSRGKTKQKVIIALARELLGFIWAIGRETQRPGSARCRPGPASPLTRKQRSSVAA